MYLGVCHDTVISSCQDVVCVKKQQQHCCQTSTIRPARKVHSDHKEHPENRSGRRQRKTASFKYSYKKMEAPAVLKT